MPPCKVWKMVCYTGGKRKKGSFSYADRYTLTLSHRIVTHPETLKTPLTGTLPFSHVAFLRREKGKKAALEIYHVVELLGFVALDLAFGTQRLN